MTICQPACVNITIGTRFVIKESVNAEFRRFPTDAYLRQTSPKAAIHEINNILITKKIKTK